MHIKDNKIWANEKANSYNWQYKSGPSNEFINLASEVNYQNWLGHGIYKVILYDENKNIMKTATLNTIKKKVFFNLRRY